MSELQKDYPDAPTFEAEAQQILSSGGMLCQASEVVGTREPVKVRFSVGGRPLGELEGESVYVAPVEGGFQVGIELRGEWAAQLQAAIEKAKEDDSKEGKKWGKDAESIFHRVAQMSPHEKIQLALKGGREERRVLLKDTHYQVHSFVLKNPRITTEEVVQISRMHSLTGEMMQAITTNVEWMQNSGVRLAIVKNAKTPANIVQKYIGQLNDSDLMIIAKSDSVRDAVSKMAIRVLASRGKVVR